MSARHLIIQALAGTGKTTTLVEGLKVIQGEKPSITPSPQQKAIWDELKKTSPEASSCFVAFNKSIASELERRVPSCCDAMTMHSLGFKACRKAFELGRPNSFHVADVISELMEQDIRKLRRENGTLIRATERLVSLCKMNLVGLETNVAGLSHGHLWAGPTDQELDELAAHYDVDLNSSRTQIYDLTRQVLERCMDPTIDGTIDFDDMIWLPIVLNLETNKYDLLLVDEAQDLNRCQQALARKCGKRLVFCGDANQAIYGFAGADSESLGRLQHDLDAKVLPLTVTRRCGRAIVKEAQAIVPQFEAHEDNEEGIISRMPFGGPDKQVSTDYTNVVRPGDMILCRTNAPLVSQCFRFLQQGRRAEIQGRDVGQGLISTVKKMKVDDVLSLQSKLDDWRHQELGKEQRKRNPSESRLIMIQDRYDCLVCFMQGRDRVQQVISAIEEVFTDKETANAIRLSSIHKAKGLEADRVFIIEPEGATIPHPMATTDWQKEQEMNLRYVAITRAIRELVYVA